MDEENDVTTLVWGDQTQRPDPKAWAISGPATRRSAERWSTLSQAINYAIGMQRDKAAEDLHPWIRTPQGHVYSPATIQAMATTMHDVRGSLPAARPLSPGAVTSRRIVVAG